MASDNTNTPVRRLKSWYPEEKHGNELDLNSVRQLSICDGFDPPEISELTGHANPESISSYSHNPLDKQRKMSNKLAGFTANNNSDARHVWQEVFVDSSAHIQPATTSNTAATVDTCTSLCITGAVTGLFTGVILQCIFQSTSSQTSNPKAAALCNQTRMTVLQWTEV